MLVTPHLQHRDCRRYRQRARALVDVPNARSVVRQITGTSVFDFQGDGKAEVLYNDECFFRVFEGATAKVLYERPNSHRTQTEYPIVVDVDGDSNSEIVVVSTGDQSTFRDRCGNVNQTATRVHRHHGRRRRYRHQRGQRVRNGTQPDGATGTNNSRLPPAHRNRRLQAVLVPPS